MKSDTLPTATVSRVNNSTRHRNVTNCDFYDPDQLDVNLRLLHCARKALNQLIFSGGP